MNESTRVQYEIEKTNEAGASRKYTFSHPYAAPADEALASLEEIKQYILVRVAEIQNYQASINGQAPTIEETTQESPGVSYGN